MEAYPEEKEPTSVDRKPEVAQQDEVPKKDAEIMPVGGPKKRCGYQKMNEWTQNQEGCQKRLVVAHREMSRHAKVAWQIKENDRKVSGHAIGAWCKRSVIRRNCIRTKDGERIWRVRMLRERAQILHKGRKGIKDIAADGRYIRRKMGQPRTASEGVDQDSDRT
jgi:hypothetical protein